jgi:hypothetical protein
MLNPCMVVINDKTLLFQIFTIPKVFAYMWSLDVSVRNDKVYYYMLKKFPNKIPEVPWARTGERFMHDEDVPDQHKKSITTIQTLSSLNYMIKFYLTLMQIKPICLMLIWRLLIR